MIAAVLETLAFALFTIGHAKADLLTVGTPTLSINTDGMSEVVMPYGQQGKMTILGVASIDDDTLKCWDVRGKSSPSFQSELLKYLRPDDNSLSYLYAQKNRYLITKINRRDMVLFADNERCPMINSFMLNDETIFISRLLPSQSAKTTSLQAVIYTGELENVVLDAIPNSTASTSELSATIKEFEMSKLKPSKNDRYFHLLGTCWKALINLNLVSKDKQQISFIEFLDKDQNVITYVDRNGAPVTRDTYIASPEPDSYFIRSARDEEKDGKSKYLKALYCRRYSREPTESLDISLNINPKYIKYIRAYAEKRIRFEVGQIALDPIE